MPLYIDNSEVCDLVDQLRAVTGKTKVAVVRDALEQHLKQLQSKPSLLDSIQELQARVQANGFTAVKQGASQ